jgi:hypothetical protein
MHVLLKEEDHLLLCQVPAAMLCMKSSDGIVRPLRMLRRSKDDVQCVEEKVKKSDKSP